MADFGRKIAKATYNVLTAADNNLVMSTKFIHPKIYSSNKISSTSQTIAHPFGYAPRFSGYILSSGKYFPYYQIDPTSLLAYQFEMPSKGGLQSDASNLYVASDVADRMVYLLMVDPVKGGTSSGNSASATGSYGRKMSKAGVNVLTGKDFELSLTTKYRVPNIVQSGEVSVVAAAVTNPGGGATVQSTAVVDVAHSLGYGAHFIVYDQAGAQDILFYPAPIGFTGDNVFDASEVYIDSSKIRFRISRTSTSDPFGSGYSFGATTYTFKYFLTNYRLPT